MSVNKKISVRLEFLNVRLLMSCYYLFLYVAMDNPLFIQAGITLRTGQTGKETENKTTNRYQLLTRKTCNKFRVFF